MDKYTTPNIPDYERYKTGTRYEYRGVVARYEFGNGMRIACIQNDYSSGAKEGFWECNIIFPNGRVDTSGFLDEEKLTDLFDMVCGMDRHDIEDRCK